MDATRITRQLEETIDEFERQKIRDIKVCSSRHYQASLKYEIFFCFLASRRYLATL